MVPQTVYGVPSHLLVLHAVVVLVPLSALGVVLMAVARRTRPILRWPVLAVLTAALAAVPAATTTGTALLQRQLADGALGGSALEKVQLHQQLGELVLWPVLGLWLATVALVALDRRARAPRRGNGRLLPAVAVLAVVLAGAATVQTVRAGHAGATAVWNPGG